jgi:hypothetical protein
VAGPDDGPKGPVEVFNSPRSLRGLAVLLVDVAACVFFGLWVTWNYEEPSWRVVGALLAGGFWGAVTLPIWIGQQHEVTFGPGTLIVRSWSEALLGRPGVNEWVGPDGAWLWRGRGGHCLVLPDGPRLGPQSKRLLEAFGRAGFSVKDEAAYWQNLNPGTWRAARALASLGFASLCVTLVASLLTDESTPIFLVGGAGFGLLVAAGVLLFARGGRPRPFI